MNIVRISAVAAALVCAGAVAPVEEISGLDTISGLPRKATSARTPLPQ